MKNVKTEHLHPADRRDLRVLGAKINELMKELNRLTGEEYEIAPVKNQEFIEEVRKVAKAEIKRPKATEE